jgi:hypothetical protein
MKTNMRIKTADSEIRPPKFHMAELQDSANFAVYCKIASSLPLLAGMGGVVIQKL